MIKIISGKYKGRIIPTIKNATYRPSTARLRESLFSILSSPCYEDNLLDAEVLDLYSGSGSLAFEALSRGAKSATLVDIDENCLKSAKAFAEKIDRAEDIACFKTSAINLPYSGRSYNLVFMDPPYGKNLVSKTLTSLIEQKWLKSGSILVIEMEKREDFKHTGEFSTLDERKYGNSKLIVMKYEQK